MHKLSLLRRRLNTSLWWLRGGVAGKWFSTYYFLLLRHYTTAYIHVCPYNPQQTHPKSPSFSDPPPHGPFKRHSTFRLQKFWLLLFSFALASSCLLTLPFVFTQKCFIFILNLIWRMSRVFVSLQVCWPISLKNSHLHLGISNQ